MMIIIKLAAIFVVSYLIGSLNFAIIYSIMLHSDIRTKGSGNAGATNVLRTYGKFPALIVFLLDMLKGYLTVRITIYCFGYNASIIAASLGVVLGHDFPVFFDFMGGKGVSTSFAVILAFMPETAIMALCIFIVILIMTRYVSLSSISASLSVIVISFIAYGINPLSILCGMLGGLCIIMHRGNILRLIAGKERKI